MQRQFIAFLILILILVGVLVACDVDSKAETVPILGAATLPDEPDFSQPLVGINTANAGAIQLLGVLSVDPMTAVAFNLTNSDQIAMGDENGTVRLMNLSTPDESVEFNGHDAMVESIAFSFDGSQLITASSDGDIRVWDTSDGSEIITVDGTEDAPQVVGFSPSGERFAIASEDRMVSIYDLPDGDKISDLSERDSTIRSLAFNALDTLLATGARDGSIQVFRIRSHALYEGFSHDSAVTALAFLYSDDGTLISGSFDGEVRFWDTANKTSIKRGSEDKILRGGRSAVRSFALSGDNTVLAVGHEDGTIVLWDIDSGSELDRESIARSGQEDVVMLAVSFLNNNRVIAGVTQSGQIWMWGPEPGAFPTETPTPTDTPTATITPTATDTLEPTETLPPTDTPENTDTPEPSDTPDRETTPTLEPSITVTSGPTVTLNATPIPTATRTLSPTPTSEASSTPTMPPIECFVSPLFDNARIRALPSVNSEQVGRVLLGESAAVDSQTLGSAGEVWWHLIELDGWVRFDIVAADESCEDVPVVELDG